MGMSKLASGRVWAYLGAGLGGAVSVAANVAHSYVPPAGAPPEWHPAPGSVAFGAFWPVDLLVVIEVLARVRWPVGWRWALLRYGGLLPVAVVAAVVSYRHLSALLAYYGEDRLTSTIGPAAVDGIMIICTGALMATAGHRATATAPAATAVPALPARPATPPAPVAPAPTPPPPAAPVPAPTPRRATPAAPRATSRATDTATGGPVAAYLARHPDAGPAEIHRATGVPRRTVDRHLSRLRGAPPRANGVRPDLPDLTIGAST